MTNELTPAEQAAYNRGFATGSGNEGAYQREIAQLKACWAEALENVTARNQEIERLQKREKDLMDVIDGRDRALGFVPLDEVTAHEPSEQRMSYAQADDYLRTLGFPGAASQEVLGSPPCPGFVTRDDGTKVYCGSGKGHRGACCCVEFRDAVKSEMRHCTNYLTYPGGQSRCTRETGHSGSCLF
jgi:hypothetical protein